MKKALILFLVTLFAFGSGFAQNKLSGQLTQALQRSGAQDQLEVIITMADQYDGSSLDTRTSYLNRKQRTEFVAQELKAFAQHSQADLLALLNEATGQVSDIQSFWIVNGIGCKATPAMIEAIAQRPDVQMVDWDAERPVNGLTYTETETDPKGTLTWNVQRIQANQVWTYNGSTGYTGAGVVVAILDSGVNYNHNDLKNNMWNGNTYHGNNYVSSSSTNPLETVSNGNGQGTMVAGIVVGQGTCGQQTGVAPGAQIMAIKITGKTLGATETRVNNGLQFAIDHGADIVVVSAVESNVGPRASYRAKMVNLLSLGIPAFTAAGDNASIDAPNSIGAPSNCPSPWHNPDETLNQGRSANICVGATNRNDMKANFSSIGPVTWEGVSEEYNDYALANGGHIRPDVMAPGVAITSTSHIDNNSYMSAQGTALSAAHAAGVAALLLEADPTLTPADIDRLLETSATKCEGLVTKNNFYGAGRIDAYEAITALLSTVSAPTNLSASADDNQVTLTWTAASGAASYNVYCNEECIATGVTGTTYSHTTDFSGAHAYCLRTVAADGTLSPKSNYAYVFVDPAGPIVQNLTATVNNNLSRVALTWELPNQTSTLRYGSADTPNGAYGGLNGKQSYWAQRYPSSMLVDYAGTRIDTVSIYFNKYKNVTYTLSLYDGDANGTDQQLYSTTFTVAQSEINAWKHIALPTPIEIDHTKDLWIVMRDPVANPSSASSGTTANLTYCTIPYNNTGFPAQFSTDGVNWSTYNNTASWMMKAHLVTGTYTYNVQRDGSTIATNKTTLSHTDTNVPAGVHYYTVTTNYNNGQSESFPCEPVRANVNTHFTVTFVPGDGSCEVESLTQGSGTGAITLPTATPSTVCQNEGYTFAGWSTTIVEGTSTPPTLLAAGTDYIPEDDCTLYAVYQVVQSEYGWKQARSLAAGDQVCLVSQDNGVEFDDVEDGAFVASSIAYDTEIQGEHPFTVQARDGGYTLTDAQGRYLDNQDGFLQLSNSFYIGCVWTAEFIDENAYLRNVSGNDTYQITTSEQDGSVVFASVSVDDLDNPTHGPIQLYRFKGSEGVFYAHAPGCGTVVKAPIFNPEADGTYTEPLAISLSCSTQGATIRYTTNNSTPTASSTAYSAPITVNNTVTVKAKAFKDGMTASPVAEQSYIFPTNYANINAFKDADNPDEIARITSTMTVVYQYGRYYWLCDDTGGLLVFDDYHVVTETLVPGDRIALLQGRYRLDHDQPMLIPLTNLSKTGTGALPELNTVTVDFLEYNYYSADAMLVQIEDVLFNRSYDPQTDDMLDTLSFIQDGHSMLLRNRFETMEESIDNTYHYDVTGLLGIYDGVFYIYPRNDNDIRQYHTITLTETQHGTLACDHEQASHLSTVTLTVTPEAGYHLESLYYYGANASNHTNIEAPYSFEMPDENITIAATFAEDVIYTVTFDAGNGNCATTSLTETEWNSGVILPNATPSTACANEGYTFVGWAENEITESMTAPELFAAGSTYHPTANLTLFAVYSASSGAGWQEVTTTQALLEGDYIIASKLSDNNRFYYLLREGEVNGNDNPKARRVSRANTPPTEDASALTHLWTVKKINSTEYSISYTENDVTYYLVCVNNYAQGNRVTTTPPTRGWTFTNNSTHGLLMQFRQATTQRYFDLYGSTGYTDYWYSHALGSSYKGELHLYLSPANVYSTNPACQMAVATPEFVNLPEGDYVLTDNYEVSLTCVTEGAVIHYTVDGSTPNESSPVFSAPFAIAETTTVNAIAFLDGEQSNMASHTFTFPAQFENIAAFKQAGNSGALGTATIARIAGDVQFVFRHENQIYLADETAGLLVRDNDGIITNTYNDGDLIQGGIAGTYYKLNQQPMLLPVANPAAGVAGSPVEPLEATAADIKADYDNYDAQLVTIVDAEFASGYNFAENAVSPANDGTAINIKNQFGTLTLSGPAGEHDDITGFVGKYVASGTYVVGIYPRSNDDLVRYYNITCATLEHGSVSTTPDHARSGDLVTLNTNPDPGYEIGQWTVTGPNGQSVTVSGNQFEMPAGDVTVSATFQQIDYTVTVIAEPAEGGIVSEGGTYHYGETIQVTAAPNPGYTFYRWYVNNIIQGSNTTAFFTITGDTEIKAVFHTSDEQYAITVESDGNGTVTGGGTYLTGTTITVTATPDEGSTFLNWTENEVEVSTESSYTFTVTRARTLIAHFNGAATEIEQNVTLATGWNWWSSYLEMDATVEGAFKEAIATTNTTATIKSMTGNIMLENSTWSTGLTLNNESMFMVLVDNPVTATLTAEAANPTLHEITLNPGWNWIGFPSAQAITLSEALAGITPNEDDVIKGSGSNASYTADYGWNGSLTSLTPGMGYMYLNGGTSALTLTYPAASKGYVRSLPAETYWTNDTHRHATNMVMLATLDADRFAMAAGNYEIGAFVGDECRGSARLQQVGSHYIAYLTIGGENAETVRFRLYDVTNATELGVAEEQLTYVANAVTGTTHNPVVLHFRSTGVGEGEGNVVSVYPNPASDWVTVEGQGLQSATLFTLTGQRLLHETIQGESTRLHVGGLSTGLYLLQLTDTDGSVHIIKLEIK